MSTENTTPDLPNFDPKADRGDDFTPAPEAATIELTDDELKAIGKEPAAAEDKAEEPAAEEKAAEEKVDEKVDEDKKAEQPRDEKGKFIPKARFDEVNRKAKARVAELERQNADLRARVGMINGEAPDVKALETQLDAKSEEYGKLIADGDLAAANAVMREINKLNRQIGMAETLALTSAHVEETQHVQSLSGLVDLYKAEYPVFDDASEHYNQDYVDFVAELQGRFERTGSSPASALQEAVELAIAKFRLDAPAEAAAPEAPAKPDKAAERKAAETKKAVEAASRQPAASLDRIGADSDKSGLAKIDVNSLSYEQFCALPESALARLRGDLA